MCLCELDFFFAKHAEYFKIHFQLLVRMEKIILWNPTNSFFPPAKGLAQFRWVVDVVDGYYFLKWFVIILFNISSVYYH